MNRLVMFAALAGLAVGCSDFSSSLDREDDGSLREQTLWLVAGGEQRVYAPGEERILSASTDDPSVADVAQINGEDLILETHSSGTTMLTLSTDVASDDSVTVEVRDPDAIEFAHDGSDWVATTGEFELSYDVSFEGQHLDGAGYKAVVSAPGMSVREVPLSLDQVGFKNGWSRKFKVLKGDAGNFTFTTALGGEYTVLRVDPRDVEEIEVDAGESQVAVGEDQFLKVTGRVDGKRVLGFERFKATSKTSSVCVVDTSVWTTGWGVQIEYRKPGECRIRVKNKDTDWEQDVVYDVN